MTRCRTCRRTSPTRRPIARTIGLASDPTEREARREGCGGPPPSTRRGGGWARRVGPREARPLGLRTPSVAGVAPVGLETVWVVTRDALRLALPSVHALAFD